MCVELSVKRNELTTSQGQNRPPPGGELHWRQPAVAQIATKIPPATP